MKSSTACLCYNTAHAVPISHGIYRELYQEGERCDYDQPDAEESKKFWGDTWSESVDHNRDAKWLKDLQNEVNVKKQEKVHITKASLKRFLGEYQVGSYQVQTWSRGLVKEL